MWASGLSLELSVESTPGPAGRAGWGNLKGSSLSVTPAPRLLGTTGDLLSVSFHGLDSSPSSRPIYGCGCPHPLSPVYLQKSPCHHRFFTVHILCQLAASRLLTTAKAFQGLCELHHQACPSAPAPQPTLTPLYSRGAAVGQAPSSPVQPQNCCYNPQLVINSNTAKFKG